MTTLSLSAASRFGLAQSFDCGSFQYRVNAHQEAGSIASCELFGGNDVRWLVLALCCNPMDVMDTSKIDDETWPTFEDASDMGF